MYSLECLFLYRVYDDNNGCYWEIRPDTEGFGCVQVTYYENGMATANQQLMAPPEAALLIAKAMIKVAEHYKMESSI